jgi:hypothetical protein
MAEKPWKRTERRVAALLGGTRVPVSGRARGDRPDIDHEWLSPEIKHRAAVPRWLADALAQARAAARDQQLPVVIIHESGARFENALVVLSLSDFVGSMTPLKDPNDAA